MVDSLSLFGDTLVLVTYHVHQTYENTYAHQREAFYDTNLATPYVVFDGTNIVVEPNPSTYETRYTEAYNVARTVIPLFNINVDSASASSSQGSFDLQIVAADTIPDDEIHAFIAICEDSLDAFGDTILFFMYVCRDLQEMTLDIDYPDTLDQKILFSHAIDVNKLSAIVFIQDMDTREVMQSVKVRF
jgi:hypothetical protein